MISLPVTLTLQPDEDFYSDGVLSDIALVQRLMLENYRVSERMFIPHWGESQMRRHFNTLKYLVGPVGNYSYKRSGERSFIQWNSASEMP